MSVKLYKVKAGATGEALVWENKSLYRRPWTTDKPVDWTGSGYITTAARA
jgi:hypothetical protein